MSENTLTTNNYYSTLSNLTLSDYACTTISGGGLVGFNNNNNKMKETKQKKIKIVFEETRVTEYTYECLAESVDSLKEKIEKGECRPEESIISLERVIKQ